MTATTPRKPNPSVIVVALKLPVQIICWAFCCWLVAQLILIISLIWRDYLAGFIYYEKLFSTPQELIHVIYPALVNYVQAVIVTTQIVLSRVITVLLFFPLFLLLDVVGLVCGLVQRYLRRINGGRESALIYHYAKAGIKPFLYWGSLLYVVLPFSLDPAWWIAPCAVVSSLAIFLTARTFKKYS
jgi:integrating conjugative element membrane protein (TIGR03747 family)